MAQLGNMAQFSSQFSRLGDDYAFSRLTKDASLASYWESPMRVNGLSMVLCFSGEINLDIDLQPYSVGSDSVIIINTDRLLQVKHVDWDTLDAYILVISPEFIRDINIDVNILNTMRVPHSPAPIIKLDSTEMALMKSYFDVIHFNTVANPDDLYVRSISRCLIAAVVYQLLQFVRKHAPVSSADKPRSRRNNYVRDFLQMLHTYYRQERSVAFYADKLFISPKYLSMIMREVTGRSAAEWIDELVILEAKNLLRFSGKNIQQIAYDLNFTNQSSFGKYFKHLTGMSPTEFQRRS